MRRLHFQVGADVRRIRLDANLSIAELGRATGISAGHLVRVEAGQANPSIEVLVAIGVALGADTNVRYFPGTGPRIHDRFQAPMIEALLRALHPRWRSEVEIPITNPARGVIDVELRDPSSGTVIATEVQSDMRRLEQQIRWGREKADGLAARRFGATEGPTEGPTDPRVSQLLLLRSTLRTRELARQYEVTLRAAFPARAADAFAALTSEAAWPGSTIVWMHLHGQTSNLMRLPPPGVNVGR